MAREKSFNFSPVDPNEVRKQMTKDMKFTPYVRLQKPGHLVFPQKTLSHLGFKIGDIFFLKFFMDKSKRAIGFKILNESMKPEDLSIYRQLKMVKYGSQVIAQTGIKPLLDRIGDYPIPATLDLEKYNDQDGYIQLGEVYYFEVPKERRKEGGQAPLSDEANEVQNDAGRAHLHMNQ